VEADRQRMLGTVKSGNHQTALADPVLNLPEKRRHALAGRHSERRRYGGAVDMPVR